MTALEEACAALLNCQARWSLKWGRRSARPDWRLDELRPQAEQLIQGDAERELSGFIDTANEARLRLLQTSRRVHKERHVDAKTEARDKWLYEQRCDITKQDKAILAELHRRCAKKGWEDIDTIQGMRDRAADYAKRHDLSPPPPRRGQ